MKRTWTGRGDNRPVVLVSSTLDSTNGTKNLGAYFRLKISRDLKADYVFCGVHRVGTLAVLVLDLKPWDRGVEILDKIEQLQNQEELFVERILEMRASFRTSIALMTTDQEASRRRFMKLQERIRIKSQIKESCPSKLMILPVDNRHGIAEELAEISIPRILQSQEEYLEVFKQSVVVLKATLYR